MKICYNFAKKGKSKIIKDFKDRNFDINSVKEYYFIIVIYADRFKIYFKHFHFWCLIYSNLYLSFKDFNLL